MLILKKEEHFQINNLKFSTKKLEKEQIKTRQAERKKFNKLAL